ncbi:MAG TPA: gamma-glutamyltransferase [Blastocatellia bacterium]|jgi:gamma-glutamyltranspeptidase/glutathione hydrolase|nr:gamma-glutamyltransferase [Blastocatellia bacterium]
MKIKKPISAFLCFALLISFTATPSQLTSFTSTRAASRPPVRGKNGMVSSVSEIASQVGVDVLKRGGNAVDAAVAVGLALAVVWPPAGNLGGGGFMIIRQAGGKATAIDYREMAPATAHRNVYLDDKGEYIDESSTYGHAAAGVPGTVAGLAYALEKYGTMRWAEVAEPARRLAAEGFPVWYQLERSLKGASKQLSRYPETKRIFLRDGKPYETGEIFKQPELAAVFERMIKRGPREFYEGKTAQLIEESMRRAATDGKTQGKTWMTVEDLKNYKAVEREPLRATYRGHEIITMPPPSSGGVALIEMLNVLERYDLKLMGAGSSQAIHTMVETMRRAFADRAQFLGDPDFVKVPVAGLISRKYADKLAATIDPDRASTSQEVRNGDPLPYESEETTHFTVVDKDGAVASNTYTINDSFGNKITVEGAGFLLNNEMDDFAPKPGAPNAYGLIQGEANAVAARKRPLSSMTPTIVLKDGKLWFAVGSPGGPTIINTVTQVIVNIIDHGMNIQQAIDWPRVHHQWMPDQIVYEPYGLAPDVINRLKSMGHQFANPRYMGDAEGVMIEDKTDMRLGGSDPRSDGKSIGY